MVNGKAESREPDSEVGSTHRCPLDRKCFRDSCTRRAHARLIFWKVVGTG